LIEERRSARRDSIGLLRVPEYMEALMTWIKPEFEVIDLCSEVTSYLYKR